MTTIKLKEYGAILTGREFGQTVLKALIGKHQPPFELDFEGVFSMGSSFGDEVLPPIAKLQGNELQVINASKTVQACIEDIRVETNIEFTFG
ncbi:MAG: DUF4325 domain-containing protein [Elusimicrobia bacterium]|nr:DUF4325 domain-containing protein [Elusimicrobiota bacterium]